MSDKSLKFKVLSEWKAIDKLLDIDPAKMSESLRKKYFATKSLLIKESEFFLRSFGVPDCRQEILTENVDLNTKDLLEFVDEKLTEIGKQKKSVADFLSEISINDEPTKKIEAKLETLLLGEAFDYILENKIQVIDDLGVNISKQLIEGYIKTLVEIYQVYHNKEA